MDFNPNKQPVTPLVEVTDIFPNVFSETQVRIFAKLPPFNNIKLLPVWNMLEQAEEQGLLREIHTIVTASSGNTGAAMAILAPQFGIEKVVVIVPRDIAPGKSQNIDILGATCRKPDKDVTPNALAEELGKQPGWLNMDQYKNDANFESFKKWLAPQVWADTHGKMTVFCASLGTTGTLLGCNRFFQSIKADVQIVGASCDKEDDVPGVRSKKRLEKIGFDWENATFPIEHDISAPQAYSVSTILVRHGLQVGPSSGLALFALLRFLKRLERQGTLEIHKNDAGEVVGVFVCPDSHWPYLEKYSTQLPNGEPLADLLDLL